MRWTHGRAIWALCLALFITPIACSTEEGDSGPDLSILATGLNEARGTMEAKQAELAAVVDEIAQAGDDVTEEAMAELEARRDTLKAEYDQAVDSVGEQAANLINQAQLVEGEEPQGDVREAILAKQDVDLAYAQEYVDQGGEYARAINILEQSIFPLLDNPKLNAALEDYKAKQYMDEERFSQIRNGMSPEEVRAILGTVNARNRKEYPDRNVEAWFYRKEDGIAGVYFEQRGDNQRVYRTDFNVQTAAE